MAAWDRDQLDSMAAHLAPVDTTTDTATTTTAAATSVKQQGVGNVAKGTPVSTTSTNPAKGAEAVRESRGPLTGWFTKTGEGMVGQRRRRFFVYDQPQGVSRHVVLRSLLASIVVELALTALACPRMAMRARTRRSMVHPSHVCVSDGQRDDDGGRWRPCT
jgi:hypothetical protein